MLALWLHGDEVVGRLTSILDVEAPPSPAQVFATTDGICAAVRGFVDAFRDAMVTPP